MTPINFSPKYTITSKIAKALMSIERARERISYLPLTSTVLASLRETARLSTTHYSTMIEGNQLALDQVAKIVTKKEHFPGREREEYEIKGYYAALTQVEQWVVKEVALTEKTIQRVHDLVMGNGLSKVKPSYYRDGQNVLRDSRTHRIVYLPPEAKDVPRLMRAMLNFIKTAHDLPCPIVAGIAHYQFATIHPYYDGNGRTARLLTTLILHRGGYGLKGLYSLEEYYARHLSAYYDAMSIGESHNYYEGRASADITKWVEYFIMGMAHSFERVLKQMEKTADQEIDDQSNLLYELDPRARKVLGLFKEFSIITAKQIAELFGLRPRTSAEWCAQWVEQHFLEVVDASKKGRKYRLARRYTHHE